MPQLRITALSLNISRLRLPLRLTLPLCEKQNCASLQPLTGFPRQAFPGSDPVAEALAAIPENSELLGARLGDNVICLISYVGKVQDIVKESEKEIEPIKTAVSNLVKSVGACTAEANIAKEALCGMQAIRDSWEGSDEVRQAAEILAEKALALAKEIKEKCFSDS